MSCHRDIEAQKCQITAKFAHWGKWHFELSEACDLIHGIEDKRNSQKITHINIWSLATLKWGNFFLQYQQHSTLWHLQVRTIILLDKYYRAFEVLFSLLGQWPPIVASLPSGGFAILNGSWDSLIFWSINQAPEFGRGKWGLVLMGFKSNFIWTLMTLFI